MTDEIIDIVANIVNGNLSDARRGILAGRSQQEAVTSALNVVAVLVPFLDDQDWLTSLQKVRNIVNGGE